MEFLRGFFQSRDTSPNRPADSSSSPDHGEPSALDKTVISSPETSFQPPQSPVTPLNIQNAALSSQPKTLLKEFNSCDTENSHGNAEDEEESEDKCDKENEVEQTQQVTTQKEAGIQREDRMDIKISGSRNSDSHVGEAPEDEPEMSEQKQVSIGSDDEDDTSNNNHSQTEESLDQLIVLAAHTHPAANSLDRISILLKSQRDDHATEIQNVMNDITTRITTHFDQKIAALQEEKKIEVSNQQAIEDSDTKWRKKLGQHIILNTFCTNKLYVCGNLLLTAPGFFICSVCNVDWITLTFCLALFIIALISLIDSPGLANISGLITSLVTAISSVLDLGVLCNKMRKKRELLHP